MKRILIVGGVAGGASAAARARRLSEEAEIVMFERGEFVSFANCGLPYHIGGDIPDRDATGPARACWCATCSPAKSGAKPTTCCC